MLRGQIDRERAKRMELKHKIRRLKKDLERHESDIEKLRSDVAHQCDHYNGLQNGHGELLMESQMLRSLSPDLEFGQSSRGRERLVRGHE